MAGIVCTVRLPKPAFPGAVDSLESWILYHLQKGFRKIFLFFDDASDEGIGEWRRGVTCVALHVLTVTLPWCVQRLSLLSAAPLSACTSAVRRWCVLHQLQCRAAATTVCWEMMYLCLCICVSVCLCVAVQLARQRASCKGFRRVGAYQHKEVPARQCLNAEIAVSGAAKAR